MKVTRLVSTLVLLIGTTGCAGLDRFSAKMDMASEHLTTAKPIYEGKVRSVQAVGPMTSLQFTDGKIMDVSEAPAGLEAGDVVRLYKTDKGTVAHLWRSAQPAPPNAEMNALAPVVPSKQ